MKTYRIILLTIAAAVALIFMSAPTLYMQSFFDGLTVWAYNVLPALFPFTVICTSALRLLPKSKRSATGKIFGISCDSVALTSLLCGYPIGAKAVSESNCDAATATAMCSFCSSAGPIFIVATVGAKLLCSTRATLILLISQLAALLINGLIFACRKQRVTVGLETNALSARDVGDIVSGAVLSVLSVGGLIALFYMLADMIVGLAPATINPATLYTLIGMLEMTNGIIGICKVCSLKTATVLCSALLSLGGVCVFLQCYAFLGTKQVSVIKLALMKITQSAIAAAVAMLLAAILI